MWVMAAQSPVAVPCTHGPVSGSAEPLMGAPTAAPAPAGTCRTCMAPVVVCDNSRLAASACAGVALGKLLLNRPCCQPGGLPSSRLRAVVQQLPDWVVGVLQPSTGARQQLWTQTVSPSHVQRREPTLTSPEQLWMVKRSFCGPPAAFMYGFGPGVCLGGVLQQASHRTFCVVEAEHDQLFCCL